MRYLSRPSERKVQRGPAGQRLQNQHPILRPEASAVVKAKGKLAKAGSGFPNSQDQCRILAPPFSSAMTLGLTMLTLKNGNIIVVTDRNANIRYIRMRCLAPADLKPTPMGDSIGRWVGDMSPFFHPVGE